MERLGVLTERRKFKKLFPEMTDEQIAAEMEELKKEKEERVAAFGMPAFNQSSEAPEEETEEQDGEDEV